MLELALHVLDIAENSSRAEASLVEITIVEDLAGDVFSLEIRDNGQVTCTGSARGQAAFMEMVDRLRARPEVREVKVQQVRGSSPQQFTFVFTWEHERQE
jgi:hypothetical protein